MLNKITYDWFDETRCPHCNHKLQKKNEPNMKAKRMIADYKKRVA